MKKLENQKGQFGKRTFIKDCFFMLFHPFKTWQDYRQIKILYKKEIPKNSKLKVRVNEEEEEYIPARSQRIFKAVLMVFIILFALVFGFYILNSMLVAIQTTNTTALNVINYSSEVNELISASSLMPIAFTAIIMICFAGMLIIIVRTINQMGERIM